MTLGANNSAYLVEAFEATVQRILAVIYFQCILLIAKLESGLLNSVGHSTNCCPEVRVTSVGSQVS